jgi:hypothetical protein
VLLHLPSTAPVVSAKHTLPGWLYWSLEMVQGIAWIYAYAMVIRCGFLDRFIGVPLVALGLNFGWEFAYAFILPNPPTQKVVDVTWVALDAVILRQAFRYGRKDHPDLSQGEFTGLVWAMVVATTLFEIALGHDLADPYGIYAGIGINMYMSFAYVTMLRRRGSSVGQSMHIAVAKCVGSLAAEAMFVAMFPDRWLLAFMAAISVVVDIVYIRLLYAQIVSEGQPVWRVSHGRHLPPSLAPLPATVRVV